MKLFERKNVFYYRALVVRHRLISNQGEFQNYSSIVISTIYFSNVCIISPIYSQVVTVTHKGYAIGLAVYLGKANGKKDHCSMRIRISSNFCVN